MGIKDTHPGLGGGSHAAYRAHMEGLMVHSKRLREAGTLPVVKAEGLRARRDRLRTEAEQAMLRGAGEASSASVSGTTDDGTHSGDASGGNPNTDLSWVLDTPPWATGE